MTTLAERKRIAKMIESETIDEYFGIIVPMEIWPDGITRRKTVEINKDREIKSFGNLYHKKIKNGLEKEIEEQEIKKINIWGNRTSLEIRMHISYLTRYAYRVRSYK